MLGSLKSYPLYFASYGLSKVKYHKNQDTNNVSFLPTSKMQGKNIISFKSKAPDLNIENVISWLGSSDLLKSIKENPKDTIANVLHIEDLFNKLSQAINSAARGFIERNGDRLKITSFDSMFGKLQPESIVTEVNFPESVKLFNPDTSADVILNQSFSQRPLVTIGPTGWSYVKSSSIDPASCKMDYFGANPAEQDKALQIAYSKGFFKFASPVIDYLESIGLKKDRIALVCSFSDVGIDNAVMEFAQKKNLNLITIGPYAFAQFMSKNHNFVTVLENTIPDYAKKFAELVDVTPVTGGRAQSLVDIKNQFIDKRGTTIAVDIFDTFCNGIKINSEGANRVLENAAAMLKKLGLEPFSSETRRIFNSMPKEGKEVLKTNEQKALAAKVYEIYKAREKAELAVA